MSTHKIEKQWTRRQVLKSVKIARVDQSVEGRRYYSYPHTLEIATIELRGSFVVEIDIDAIVRDLSYRAAYNSTGKATALGGFVKAKRLNETEISRKVTSTPIPEGFSEVRSDESEVKGR